MKKQKLTPQIVWQRYHDGIGFNTRIDLDDEVETNENFFLGKQWEGVKSNGLPTPVFNFLKRVVLFTVASVTSDNLKLQAQPLGNSGAKGQFYKMTNVVNNEFDSIFEFNKVVNLMREVMRNAAVDGDGCTHTYWEPTIETGQANKGGIVTEVIENTRVFFGNPNDRRVQKQPYIIIERRFITENLRERAEDLGVKNWDMISPDSSGRRENHSEMISMNDRTTCLLYYYKSKETGTVHCYECTRNVELRDIDTGLKLYPITWLNWDYRQDNYHGQSMVSGLIPNQIFINRAFAMTELSLMTTAYPKIVYDATRITRWTNQVGAAVGIKGGDVNNVAKVIEGAHVDPQIAQFIQLAVNYTETFLGATPAALGDVRPDNTSAIIALQRASATPHELTKQNLYSSMEDLGRIYVDFMANYYGIREVEVQMPKDIPEEIQQFINVKPGEEITGEFDFATLKEHPMVMRLDVGASAYWSEIASMQTLDNLLMQNKIDLIEYLERIPDGYISMRQELLEKLRTQQEEEKQQQAMQQGAPGMGAPAGGSALAPQLMDSGQPIPIPEGSGYGELQRAINQTGVAD